MISLNEVINFYSLVDFSVYRIIFNDFEKCKVKQFEEIEDSNDEARPMKKFFTPTGVPLLHQCIDNEPKDDSKPWPLEEVFEYLVDDENKLELDINQINANKETPLLFALKQNKMRAFK